jgi:hypothetical protein
VIQTWYAAPTMAMNEIDWEHLKRIAKWTPLRKLPFDHEKVGYNLFKVREDTYLIAVSRNRIFETDAAPYVTILAWAENEGAARRSLDMQIEADVNPSMGTPPLEMLLPGPAMTYGEIISELKDSGLYSSSMEHASYRLTDGGFIEARIDTLMGGGPLRYKFCFRSPRCEESDVPYAVHYVLTG